MRLLAEVYGEYAPAMAVHPSSSSVLASERKRLSNLDMEGRSRSYSHSPSDKNDVAIDVDDGHTARPLIKTQKKLARGSK